MESTEYKYRLENRVLEITTDLRSIDRAILRNMPVADIEKLGKATLEAIEVLEKIKERNHEVKRLIENKKAKDKGPRGNLI